MNASSTKELSLDCQSLTPLDDDAADESMTNSESEDSSSSEVNEDDENLAMHLGNDSAAAFSNYSREIGEYQLSLTIQNPNQSARNRETDLNGAATSINDSERSFPSDKQSSVSQTSGDGSSTIRDDGSQPDDNDDNFADTFKPKMSLLELAHKLKQVESRVLGRKKSAKQSASSCNQEKSIDQNSQDGDDDSMMSDDDEEDYHTRLYGDDYKRMIRLENSNIKAENKANSNVGSNSIPSKTPVQMTTELMEQYFDGENGLDLSCSGMSSYEASPCSIDVQGSNDLLIRRRHRCRFCKYSTDRLSHLRRHELSIHFRGGTARQRAAPLNGSQSGHTSPGVVTPMMVANPDSIKLLSPEKRKHQCEFCGYQTDCVSHLRRHMGSVHDREKLFRCNVCADGVEFARSEKVKEHFRIYHPELNCDLKQLRTPPPPKPSALPPLRVHPPPPPPSSKRSEDDPDDVAVDDASADAELAELVNLSIATKIKGTKPFRCPQCTYAARDVWHMRRHIGDRHVRQRHYKCRVCRYETGRIDRLFTHQRSHGEMFCLYCENYSTAHADSYKRHMISCASTRTGWTWDSTSDPFCGAGGGYSAEKTEQERTCRVCNIVYADIEEMELHIDSDHIEREPPSSDAGDRTAEDNEEETSVRFTCKLCDYESHDRVDICVHVNSHSPLSFPCDSPDCDFKSTYARTLELHRKFYHGIKPESLNKKGRPAGVGSEENSMFDASGMGNYMSGVSDVFSAMASGNQNGFHYNPYLGNIFGNDDVARSSKLNEMISASMGFFAGGIPPQMMAYFNEAESYRELYGHALRQQSDAAHRSFRSGLSLGDSNPGRGLSDTPQLFSQASASTSASFRPESPEASGAGADLSSGIFKCPICVDRAPFKYRRSFEKHLTQHATSLNLCPLCTDTFSSATELQRHLVLAHSNKMSWNNSGGQH